MIKAPITPGIQPKQVKINTIRTEPQPLSITANGGKIIESRTLNNDMIFMIFLGRFLSKIIFVIYNLRLLNMRLYPTTVLSKCPEQDSNLHVSQHSHLKRTRLPFRHPGFVSSLEFYL